MKRVFVFVMLISLWGCGSDDKDKPASLKLTEFGELSPFDTLIAPFNRNIRKPEESNVASNYPVQVLHVNGAKLTLAGDDELIAGFPRFTPNVKHFRVTFKDIEAKNGDIQSKDQILNFSTLPFVDKDFTSEYTEYNNFAVDGDVLMSEDGKTFFDGSTVFDGVKFAGILEHRKSGNYKDDLEDYFLVKLMHGDSVEIILDGMRQAVDLEFSGPRLKDDPEQFYTFSIKSENKALKQEKIIHRIGDEHSEGAEGFQELADYAIRVYFPDLNPPGPTPYTLSVKVISRK